MGNTAPKMMDGKPVVLVVGGGPGGSAVARILDKTGEFNVVLIDRKNYYLHNIGALRATVDPHYAHQILIPYDKLLKHGAFVQAEVIDVSPQGVRVHGRDEPIKFDYLVIATGSSYAFPAKLAEPKLEVAETKYTEVNKVLNGASKIVIVGGGAVGVELAGEIATDFKGKKEVTLIHAHAKLIEGGLSDKFKAQVLDGLHKLGVKVILGERVVLDEKEKKDMEAPMSFTTGTKTITTDKGTSVEAELVFYCGGTKINNKSFLHHFKDLLNAQGRLHVAPTMQLKGHDHIFALGDCAGDDTKMAYFAGVQASIVAKNIQLMQKKKTPLQEYKKQGPVMFVTIGRKGGVGELGGRVLGNTVVKMLKSGELFTSKTWSSLNQKLKVKQLDKERQEGKHLERRSSTVQVYNLKTAMKITEEEADKIAKEGLPEVQHQGEDHV